MSAAAIPITQKLLVTAGGWPAMKQAQQLHAAGRVTDATYDPPLLAGLVREGNRSLRSGLRIKSEKDVENICTCRESREWGRICPHALAVGLAFLQPAKPVETPTPASAPERKGPNFVEIGAQA
ncbi:MAG TPA: hypothetical protein VG095_00535, partial [Chthoniobacterales bacterium]|nr:hypothetical protein [Chthoniobacterales bacterium]